MTAMTNEQRGWFREMVTKPEYAESMLSLIDTEIGLTQGRKRSGDGLLSEIQDALHSNGALLALHKLRAQILTFIEQAKSDLA